MYVGDPGVFVRVEIPVIDPVIDTVTEIVGVYVGDPGVFVGVE